MTISIIGNLFTNKRMRIKLPHIAQTLYTEALAEFGGVLIGQVLQQNHTVRDAMCSAVCTCPTAVRLWQSYFALRMGQSPSVLTEVADLIGGLHFELVHGLLGLGDAPRLLEELLLLIIKLSFSVREASLPEGCDPLSVGVFCPGARWL